MLSNVHSHASDTQQLHKYKYSTKTKVRRELSHLQWPAISGPLPGSHQTVARAELFAVAEVVRRQQGDLTVWTDHQPLIQIWNKIQQKGIHAVGELANQDLWDDIVAHRMDKQQLHFRLLLLSGPS